VANSSAKRFALVGVTVQRPEGFWRDREYACTAFNFHYFSFAHASIPVRQAHSKFPREIWEFRAFRFVVAVVTEDLPSPHITCYASGMARILLTAFQPYDPWPTNASWLALVEFTRELPAEAEITTRLYPVELNAMKEKLAVDLRANFDVALHVGQAPHASCVQLEEMALNVASNGKALDHAHGAGRVCDSGPDAYRSQLPVRLYAKAMREAGIPARVSFHAGTFLCNAILYWSCRLTEELQLPTKSTFVHVPLDTSQVMELDEPMPFMPSSMAADALRLMVQMAASEVPHQMA
jgi:pyroglutamyl-peptidase